MVKGWKKSKMLPTDEWLNKMYFISTIEFIQPSKEMRY
jgi:hypothetical protein